MDVVVTGTPSRGWGWAKHLRAGGTTRWSDFAGPAAAPDGPFLPGVAQLELARRFNEVSDRREVTRRILATGSPARGRQELPLAGASPERPYGPRPVHPREVPLAELVRVGVGVLAESLAQQPVAVAPAPPSSWLRRFRGNGGNGVLVLPLASVDRLLHDAWVARARHGRVLPWQRWTARLAQTDRIPGPLQFVRRAEEWRATGFRRRVELSPGALLAPVDPNAADLVRRLHPLLGGLVTTTAHEALTTGLLGPWLDARTASERLALPTELRPWATSVAERIAADVRRAGYPVRGDLAVLHDLADVGATRPPVHDVLGVTLQVLANGWETAR